MNATSQLNSTSRLTDAMFLVLYFDTEEGDSYHINKACRTMILKERYNCSLRC